MNKLLEIADAWITALNPSKEVADRAKERTAICESCPSMRFQETLKYHYCGECSCPISKKVFSAVPPEEACPLKKWKR